MNETAKLAVKVLDDHKALDIDVIDVRERTPFTEFMILATALNERSLNAFAEAVREEAEKDGHEVRKIEGTSESGWLIVDIGDTVVSILSPTMREKLSLGELLRKKDN